MTDARFNFLSSFIPESSNSETHTPNPHANALKALASFCRRSGERAPTEEENRSIIAAWKGDVVETIFSADNFQIRFFCDAEQPARRGAEVVCDGFSSLTQDLLRSLGGNQPRRRAA